MADDFAVPAARGVVFIHSAPSALCPHVEWAINSALSGEVTMSWQPQPAEPGSYRAEFSWRGPAGSGAAIASALQGWDLLRFEVTEDATAYYEGSRYSYVPELGLFHGVMGVHGDLMITEDRLKAVRAVAANGEADLNEALDALLGVPWDAELEAFRYAGEGAPVRWLHQVV
ncbi:DUF3145 domain-containing protein [Aeromicrobium sp.]|uniref:DUF3145 domain-containing protein n=1 Tax=Aeromicrobium sp. TaxID=1871063 RepID=UPI0039E659C4